MTQDPDRRPASASDGGQDVLDETQQADVPHFTPAPDPRPDTRWAWATSNARPGTEPVTTRTAWGETLRHADPQDSDPATWARPEAEGTWNAPASSATASWGNPFASDTDRPLAAAGYAGTNALPNGGAAILPASHGAIPRRGAGTGVGMVAVVAILAAVIASSGTVLALDLSGAFREPAPAAATAGFSTSGQAPAQTSTGSTDEASAIITSSAKVSPSVVKITTTGATTDPFSGSQDQSVGSGVIYDSGGWILTNHHVVAGADSLKVELKDGRSFAGTVYGVDTLTDLAIIKVDATGLPAASIGSSDALKVGQLVIAVGSPLGTYSFSVTSGIVSGKGRQYVASDGSTISNLIQTDAAINPGNLGGPLADADGNVVAINTVVADGSSGIGFAIPIDIAKPIMRQAVQGEKLQRPWIGVYFEIIDQKVKADEHLSVDNGALVINTASGGGSAILPNSPAAAAGLKDGDVITAINGTALDAEHPLNLMLVQFAPNDTIQLTVIRGGQTITVPVTLGIRPQTVQ